ncbi:ribosomal protein S6 [Thermocrinis albus DSM 14484]|uniref:Small ribosomal subunit protein bS6 n=1 Tax=Thermocrinis albus (strain DSM 14484 / JCM 11386 / HI 11/12) TaxID=638303 RepID=D3SNS1_THEAH|nr:30S ribosomal protein S6 [Thermocrinis albus]ADC88808.1 ribosomal protein S6 [Thermocrinis albus DSM 14484]
MARRYYETVRHYESVVVFKPTLSEEEVQRRLQEVREFITKKGGQILEEQDWGLKQLAYPINRFQHGRYYLFLIRSENPELPNELDFFYKINDDVIRWLNIKVKRQTEKAHAQ